MGSKVLVVGGTGFIGAALTRAISRRSHSCTVLSKYAPSTSDIIEGVEYMHADIFDECILSEILKGRDFEFVVNLAGYVDHSAYNSGGYDVLNTHFFGLMNLVRQLNHDKLKRFINVGSSNEYGVRCSPLQEDKRELPSNPYSFAKVASTQFLQSINRAEGFPAVIVRLFLVYGETQPTNRVISQVVEGCLRNEVIELSGGAQERDFCYIEDVIDGILACFHCEEIVGEVVNIASGVPVSIRDVATSIRDIIGLGHLDFNPSRYRPGENQSLYADIGKANKLLGWKPSIKLDEGLRRVIKFKRCLVNAK